LGNGATIFEDKIESNKGNKNPVLNIYQNQSQYRTKARRQEPAACPLVLIIHIPGLWERAPRELINSPIQIRSKIRRLLF
jgi:hypothetical protein